VAAADPAPPRPLAGWERVRPAALAVSFGLLLLVGLAAPSAARPALGPRGWAPGDLPLHLSSAAVTAALWVAYLLGGLAVLAGLAGARPGAGRLRHGGAWLALRGWGWPLALAALALLTSPFGSADHTNYAAYGRISAQGGDPYLVPPVTWHGGTDPVTSAVEPPWTLTPSIYGPFATLVQTLTSLVGGDNLRQTVWAGQVVVVLAWLAVRWLLLRAAPGPARQRRVDVLWTANPLVFGVAVLGAHLDLLATALALAAILLAARRPGVAGLLLGAALSTKVTYGVAGLAILWSWRALERREALRRAAALVAGAVVVALPLHLWAGPHVFEQLQRSRRSVSLATPWRPLVELLTGPLPGATVRNLVFAAAVLVMVVLAVLLARVAGAAPATTTGAALRATFVLTTAYALAAPYSLPWYDVLTMATLPALAATPLDALLTARWVVVTLAYVPGRVVAMSAGVEGFTLGVRRSVAPYAGWLVWAVVAWLAWRAWSSRRTGSRPAASAR
jgi:hypothetical protein